MNIFENTYYSKPYKTRDGRKAIYLGYKDSYHIISPQDYNGIIAYKDDGLVCEGEEQNLDIVSEWEEPINEEELDRLAKGFTPFELIPHYDIKDGKSLIKLLKECFKAGYRKAKFKICG